MRVEAAACCAARDVSAARIQRVLYLCFICLGFQQLCSGHEVPCNVTQVNGHTSYSVPEFTASKCNCRWTNSTNHVLANEMPKMDKVVVKRSNRTLVTNVCLDLIYYMRDCISEGTPREANCTTTCTGNNGLHHGGGNITENFRSHWTAMAVFILWLVLVLVLGVLFLCRKFRNHRYF